MFPTVRAITILSLYFTPYCSFFIALSYIDAHCKYPLSIH